jgi:hypothetical protein
MGDIPFAQSLAMRGRLASAAVQYSCLLVKSATVCRQPPCPRGIALARQQDKAKAASRSRIAGSGFRAIMRKDKGRE